MSAGTSNDQKSALDSLELEIQEVVDRIPDMATGNGTWALCKSSKLFSPLFICTDPTQI